MKKTWIETVIEKGRSLPEDQQICPFQDNEVAEGEKVLGVVDPAIRCFASEANRIRIEAKEKIDAHLKMHVDNVIHDPEVCNDFRGEVSDMKEMSNLLMSIFWTEIRGSNPEYKKVASLGVRKDWQIVSIPEKDEDGPSDLAGLILAAAGSDSGMPN